MHGLYYVTCVSRVLVCTIQDVSVFWVKCLSTAMFCVEMFFSLTQFLVESPFALLLKVFDVQVQQNDC